MSSRQRNRMSLLVRNLKFQTSPDKVREIFERFGSIRDVYLPLDFNTKRPRGFGFVEYHDERDAQTALDELDNIDVDGNRIEVTLAQRGRSSPDAMREREPPKGRSNRDGREGKRGRSRSRSRSRSRGRFGARRRSPSDRRRSHSRDRRRDRGGCRRNDDNDRDDRRGRDFGRGRFRGNDFQRDNRRRSGSPNRRDWRNDPYEEQGLQRNDNVENHVREEVVDVPIQNPPEACYDSDRREHVENGTDADGNRELPANGGTVDIGSRGESRSRSPHS